MQALYGVKHLNMLHQIDPWKGYKKGHYLMTSFVVVSLKQNNWLNVNPSTGFIWFLWFVFLQDKGEGRWKVKQKTYR